VAKLSLKLGSELEPGARVISNTFEISAWTPTLAQNLEDVMCPQVFHYEITSLISGIQQFIDTLPAMIV